MNACSSCKSYGHTTKDCPNRKCYICHQTGHVARTCPRAGGVRDVREVRDVRDVRSNLQYQNRRTEGGQGMKRGRGGPGECWNCGKKGHIARDCGQASKTLTIGARSY